MYTVLMVCMGERERSLAWLLNIKSENHLFKLSFREVRTPKRLRRVGIFCNILVLAAAKLVLSVFLCPVCLLGTCTSTIVWGSGSPYAVKQRCWSLWMFQKLL